MEKLREELERSQATVGKAQIGQEKTQSSLDKVQSELDQLQERYERQSAEMRRVSVDYHYYRRMKGEWFKKAYQVKASEQEIWNVCFFFFTVWSTNKAMLIRGLISP